jgi:3-ketosteroid 9alpha-monooxygenase subunit A
LASAQAKFGNKSAPSVIGNEVLTSRNALMTENNALQKYPISWYQVAWSKDLPKRSIKSVTLGNHALVIYRTNSGEAHALDAHCPHLGAHLGVKGKVLGKEIRCAFHGWQFDGQGACKKIPSDGKITPLMNTRSWRLVERYGMIFVHYDPDKQRTNDEFVLVPQFEEGAWSDPVGESHYIFTRHSDILENGVDMEHFYSVHGVPMNNAQIELAANGNLIFRHQTITKRLGISFNTMMEIIYIHPGLQIIHLHSVLGKECVALSSVRPVGNDAVVAQLTTRVKKDGLNLWTTQFTHALSFFINSTFAQDIPIWNGKIFKDRPVLAKGDDGIPSLRRWYNNFPVAI